MGRVTFLVGYLCNDTLCQHSGNVLGKLSLAGGIRRERERRGFVCPFPGKAFADDLLNHWVRKGPVVERAAQSQRKGGVILGCEVGVSAAHLVRHDGLWWLDEK